MPCEQPCYENLARGVAKLFSTKVIHFSKKLKLNYWILEKKAQRNIIKLINYWIDYFRYSLFNFATYCCCRKYIFYLSFENGICEDYSTEKFYSALGNATFNALKSTLIICTFILFFEIFANFKLLAKCQMPVLQRNLLQIKIRIMGCYFFLLHLILTFKIHFKSMSKQKELLQPFKLLKNWSLYLFSNGFSNVLNAYLPIYCTVYSIHTVSISDPDRSFHLEFG